MSPDRGKDLPLARATPIPDQSARLEALKAQQDKVGDIPVPPKYGDKDFQKANYWKLRGKLDVPKERFISYPGAERDGDTSMVIGWAGWDHLDQSLPPLRTEGAALLKQASAAPDMERLNLAEAHFFIGQKLLLQGQRDEAMRSCGMAAMNLMLTAKSMGYDTCPMDGFDFDKVGELLNLPKDHIPSMFVCVGKGIKEAMPRGGQLPLDQVVIQNQFK